MAGLADIYMADILKALAKSAYPVSDDTIAKLAVAVGHDVPGIMETYRDYQRAVEPQAVTWTGREDVP